MPYALPTQNENTPQNSCSMPQAAAIAALFSALPEPMFLSAPAAHDPGGKAHSFSGWAAVLLLHLLALLLATIVNVVVNASVVGAVIVASPASASPCTRLTFNIPLLTYVAPAFLLCFCFCFFLLLLVFLSQLICAIAVLR